MKRINQLIDNSPKAGLALEIFGVLMLGAYIFSVGLIIINAI